MKPGRQNRKGREIPSGGAGTVVVDDEQRRHLAQCCAFFLAMRNRPGNPGGYRREDLKAAEASIDAIIRKHQPK